MYSVKRDSQNLGLKPGDSPTTCPAGRLFFLRASSAEVLIPQQLWTQCSGLFSQFVLRLNERPLWRHTHRHWSVTSSIAEYHLMLSLGLRLAVVVPHAWFVTLAHECYEYECYAMSAAWFSGRMGLHTGTLNWRLFSHWLTCDSTHHILWSRCVVHGAAGTSFNANTPYCYHAISTNSHWCTVFLLKCFSLCLWLDCQVSYATSFIMHASIDSWVQLPYGVSQAKDDSMCADGTVLCPFSYLVLCSLNWIH